MSTSSRRTFIINSLGLASAGLVAPSLLLRHGEALGAALGNPIPGAADAGFKIVENGVARAIVVTPDEPSLVVQYAVRELQWHVQRATGARLDVVSQSNAGASPLKSHIYLGPGTAARNAGIVVDDLAPNSYRMKTTANALFLVGKDDRGKPQEPATRSHVASWKGFTIGAPPLDDAVSMGSLFAVYDWLERQVGAKWLWPGELGTFVPKTETVGGGALGEITRVPALIHSRPRLNVWRGMDAARKDQYIYDTSVWLRRQRFARGVSFEYGHAYTKYWDRFGATHPEYFALRPDGVRAPYSLKRADLVQMCVSNPGLHGQIIADWLVQRENDASLPWINGCENDKTVNDPSCTCPVCRSWDPPNAPLLPHQAQRKAAIGDSSSVPMVSLSDRYARFWLALQQEGEKHDPNTTVIGLAYADYTQPPVATQLNDRIIVGIVAPSAFPLSAQEEADFQALWNGWAKTGARLFLRPNFFLTGYCVPYIFARQFAEVFQYAASHRMIADDFDSLLGMWGAHGPNLYTLGRLNVDANQDVSDILNDYYSGFGPAATQVQKYFSYWEGITRRCTTQVRDEMKGGWGFISYGGDVVFTPETFANGHALLRDAKAAAAGDDEATRRVAFLEVWLENGDLSMQALEAYHALHQHPGDRQLQAALAQAKGAVDAFREAHADEIVNVGVLRQLEVWSGWRKASELSLT